MRYRSQAECRLLPAYQLGWVEAQVGGITQHVRRAGSRHVCVIHRAAGDSGRPAARAAAAAAVLAAGRVFCCLQLLGGAADLPSHRAPAPHPLHAKVLLAVLLQLRLRVFCNSSDIAQHISVVGGGCSAAFIQASPIFGSTQTGSTGTSISTAAAAPPSDAGIGTQLLHGFATLCCFCVEGVEAESQDKEAAHDLRLCKAVVQGSCSSGGQCGGLPMLHK